MAAAAVFILALLLYLATATPTITAQHGGADGGELTTTALSGGVAHPPGYPTYLVLARVALLWPWSEPAARLALLSAVAAAAAAACTATLLVLSKGHQPAGADNSEGSTLAALSAGLLLAVSPLFWSQAIIVEVYALHMLWLSLCALLVMRWLHTARCLGLLAAALCLGVGLGVHLTLLMVVPATILAWFFAENRPALSIRLGALALVVCLAGSSVYALLPIWSARDVFPSWGDQTTLAGFWIHLSSAEYRYLVGRVPLAQQLSRLSFVAHDLLTQLGVVGLALAVFVGIPTGWRADRLLMVFTGCVALFSLVFAIGYGGADSEVYLLPWIWAWCIWAGLGAGTVVVELKRRSRWVALLPGIMLLALLSPAALRYPQLSLRHNTSERERVLRHITSLPSEAILLTSDDADTFGAWYTKHALGVRLDVVVIDSRLAQHPWYQAQLQRTLGAAGLCRSIQESRRPVYQLHSTNQLTELDTATWKERLKCAHTAA